MKEFNYQDYLRYQKLKAKETNSLYELREDDIEIYNSEHISYMFQKSESDVIYTGNGKWNVEKYIEECQEILSEADCVKLGEYYVLDVNDYTKEELEKDKWFLSKMLLLEKLKSGEEIYHMLNTAIEKEDDNRNKAILKRIIAFILDEKLNPEDREELLKKLEGGEKDMVLEVIRKENESLIKRGKTEGKIEILKQAVKNMLQFGEDEEKIMKYIGINKEELESIKRMLKTVI